MRRFFFLSERDQFVVVVVCFGVYVSSLVTARVQGEAAGDLLLLPLLVCMCLIVTVARIQGLVASRCHTCRAVVAAVVGVSVSVSSSTA